MSIHKPLNLPANRRALIEKAASIDEGCMSVGGLAARANQQPSMAKLSKVEEQTLHDLLKVLHEQDLRWRI